MGVDSFFVHSLATSISTSGHIPWILNPLGYFGWYPLSYPSAGPVIISGVGLATGIAEEGAILALSLLYGAVAALSGFMMARTFRADDLFALIVAGTFSLAPRLMSFTLWSASTRNLFMILIPVFLWLLIRSYFRPNGANFLLLVSVLILMIATHRLTILLAVVVLAFVAAYAFIMANRVVRLQFPKALLSKSFRRWAPYVTLLGIVLIAAFMLVGTDVLREYEQGEICSGGTTEAKLCNLGVSLTRSVGMALPFAFLGAFFVVREYNRGFLEAFLALSLLSLIPTLFLRQYTGFYILPFLSLFAGFGVIGLARLARRRPRAARIVIIACVVAIVASSIGILEVEVDRATTVSDANYTAALFLHALPPGNFVANDGLLGIRVSAVTGRGVLPIGGAGTTHQSPELLIMGAYNASEVFRNEHRIPLTELTIEDDSPFLLLTINAREDWAIRIMQSSVDSVRQPILERYDLQYYLENDLYRDAYVAFGNLYDARRYPELVVFPVTLHQVRYKLFDGTSDDIYLAFPPLS